MRLQQQQQHALLGDGITDDTLLHIARFLPAATDLLRLQLTSKRFGTRIIAAPSGPPLIEILVRAKSE